jgi:hypothetical protein
MVGESRRLLAGGSGGGVRTLLISFSGKGDRGGAGNEWLGGWRTEVESTGSGRVNSEGDEDEDEDEDGEEKGRLRSARVVSRSRGEGEEGGDGGGGGALSRLCRLQHLSQMRLLVGLVHCGLRDRVNS